MGNEHQELSSNGSGGANGGGGAAASALSDDLNEEKKKRIKMDMLTITTALILQVGRVKHFILSMKYRYEKVLFSFAGWPFLLPADDPNLPFPRDLPHEYLLHV